MTKAFRDFAPELHLGVLEWLAGWLAEFAFHPHLIFKSCHLCIFFAYDYSSTIKDGGVVKNRSFALVTEENDHSFNISCGLNKFMLTLRRNKVNIKHAKFWSDGCASQFCSQHAFYMMTKLDQDIKIGTTLRPNMAKGQ